MLERVTGAIREIIEVHWSQSFRNSRHKLESDAGSVAGPQLIKVASPAKIEGP